MSEDRNISIYSRAFSGPICSLALLLLLPVSVVAEEEIDARMWLDRMAHASQMLNYDGTFIYRNGGRVESMRIIHRRDPDGERERLVSLNGVAREVIRDPSRVTCILPDSRSVVVTKSRPRSLMLAQLYGRSDTISKHYKLRGSNGDRVAGRTTKLVAIQPRDHYRYGYRLSIDEETALLLRSELVTGDGIGLEQIIYTSIALPEIIPDELLRPGISDEGFKRISSEPRTASGTAASEMNWSTDWLPDGFVMGERTEDPGKLGRRPVEQMVYTDGLASLSVFIERLEATSERLEGLSTMGAVNAFGRLVDGFQVTVVGEVPAVTVESVAGSVRRQ